MIKVSLVKGKAGWKIGSVSEVQNYYTHAADQAARGSVVKIIKILRRFLTGEETSTELFDEYIDALTFFSGALNSNRTCYEHIFIQRVLASLGYIKATDVPEQYARNPLQALDANIACEYDKQVALSIERAQTASHL